MKKFFEKIIVMLMVLIISAAVCACGNKASDDAKADSSLDSETAGDAADSEATEKAEKKAGDELKIEDIDWNIDESVVDGDRTVAMSLTNNSDYTLAGFDISFTEKSDISEEEKENFYSDIKEKFEASDDDMEQLKSREIGMHAGTERIIEPGDSINGAKVYYYQGYFYMKSLEHYALVTPDIAEISYIDGDKIYKEYYDFKAQKYSMDEKTEDREYWTDTAIGSAIPKPDAPVIKSEGLDDEDIFMFKAYGMTADDFDSYVSSCKEMGYTVDASEHEGFYSADNSEGYNIYTYYDEDDYAVNVTAKAPDEDAVSAADNSADNADSEDATDETDEAAGDDSSVSPEFKETMDDYKAFFDEYVDYMNSIGNGDSLDALSDYASMSTKYAEIMAELDNVKEEELSKADYAYYLDTMNDINKKLLEVGD